MMEPPTYTLSQLAETIGADVQGDKDCQIGNIAPLTRAKPGDITYLTDKKYQKYLSETQASAVLLDAPLSSSCHLNALVMKNPKKGLIQLLQLLRPQRERVPGIHPTAVIGKNCDIGGDVTVGPYTDIGDRVRIGAKTVIGASVSIGEDTCIGEHCHFYSRVTVYHNIQVGSRVMIHSGAVIGADGFGLMQDEAKAWLKIPQVGRVIIGNDVEIGANTTIDRGALDDTVIGNGVKIDNLVMVGHNVQIGDHTAIAGCAGIAGSTRIGRYCMIGASAGINGHIDICDHVMITGMGMIQKSITEPGIYSSGTGMQNNREWHKSVIRFRQLDEMARRLKKLEKIYDELNGN